MKSMAAYKRDEGGLGMGRLPGSVGCAGILLFAAGSAAKAEETLLGFSRESAAQERRIEAELDPLIKAENQRLWMERLAGRPHHVGSPHGRENAEAPPPGMSAPRCGLRSAARLYPRRRRAEGSDADSDREGAHPVRRASGEALVPPFHLRPWPRHRLWRQDAARRPRGGGAEGLRDGEGADCGGGGGPCAVRRAGGGSGEDPGEGDLIECNIPSAWRA